MKRLKIKMCLCACVGVWKSGLIKLRGRSSGCEWRKEKTAGGLGEKGGCGGMVRLPEL